MWKCKGSFDLDFLYKQFSGKGEILSEKSMYETERVFRHSPCIFLISLTFSCKILNQSLSDRLDYKNLALSVNRDNLFGKGFFLMKVCNQSRSLENSHCGFLFILQLRLTILYHILKRVHLQKNKNKKSQK